MTFNLCTLVSSLVFNACSTKSVRIFGHFQMSLGPLPSPHFRYANIPIIIIVWTRADESRRKDMLFDSCASCKPVGHSFKLLR